MAQYRVRLTEKVNYWVDVQAEDADEACTLAEEIWCQADAEAQNAAPA